MISPETPTAPSPRTEATLARTGVVALLLTVALLAVGCSSDSDEAGPTSTTSVAPTTTEAPTTTAAPTTSAAPTTTEATTTTTPPAPDCSVYGPDGQFVFADVSTEPEILEMLGDGWTSVRDDTQFVDLEGLLYQCGGETIFYGAWTAGGSGILEVLISWHPSVVDGAGVGPEMSLTDAIALRGGAATATVNFDNEQREFIEFADGGDADWSYVGRSETNGYAGVYADQTTSIWETDVFAPDAEIAQVWWQPPVTG